MFTYIYICIYIYIHIHMYIYVYIYIQSNANVFTAKHNRCDSKNIHPAFVFGSRIVHIWALS